MKFTPVDDNPFVEFGRAAYAGAFGDPMAYAKERGAMTPPRAVGLATGQVLGGYAKGISDSFGKVLRAAHGEAIPQDELIDATRNVASVIGTGGTTFGRAPVGALGANLAAYPKDYLLNKVPESLKNIVSDIYDHGVNTGQSPTVAALSVAGNKVIEKPFAESENIYTDHIKAASALLDAMKSPPVSLAKAAPGPTLGSILGPALGPAPGPTLSPLDWRNYVPPEGRTLSPADEWLAKNPEVANLLFKAKEQGYNVNTPLFKGMSSFGGEGFRPPGMNKSESGLFFSTNPDIAVEYTGNNGVLVPAYARAQNPLQANWAEATGGNENYSPEPMSNLLSAARNQNADLLAIHGIGDIGPKGFEPQTQVVVFDPTLLRSPWARFDPTQMGSSNLLASRGVPIFTPVDHDPWEEQR